MNDEDVKRISKIANRMYLKTQGSRKLLAYVNNIIVLEEFQNKIHFIREMCHIPKNGYRPLKDNILNAPPNIGSNIRMIIDKEIDKICKKYNLHIVEWNETFTAYIYYNRFIKPWDFTFSHLCHVCDLKEETENPFSKHIIDFDNKVYPVAIRISPYATKRDILDFINVAYPLIKLFQEQHKDTKMKIGKYKKRDPKNIRRNEFIYKNRSLRLKDIAIKLQRKFNIDLDEGSIGKIISLETKRRKKL